MKSCFLKLLASSVDVFRIEYLDLENCFVK